MSRTRKREKDPRWWPARLILPPFFAFLFIRLSGARWLCPRERRLFPASTFCLFVGVTGGVVEENDAFSGALFFCLLIGVKLGGRASPFGLFIGVKLACSVQGSIDFFCASPFCLLVGVELGIRATPDCVLALMGVKLGGFASFLMAEQCKTLDPSEAGPKCK